MRAPVNLRVEQEPYPHLRDDEGCVLARDFQNKETLAGQWALENGIDITVYEADWAKLGTSAGPARNQQMLNDGKPDLVVAFPGGRGTADMVRRARAAGLRVVEPLSAYSSGKRPE